MQVLIVGNGFDLAHGLPTRYRDFLDFTIAIKKIFDPGKNLHEDYFHRALLDEIKRRNKNEELWSVLDQHDNYFQNLFHTIKNNSYLEYLKNNYWIDYFLRPSKTLKGKDKWIDFETEMSKVIFSVQKAWDWYDKHKSLDEFNYSGTVLAKILGLAKFAPDSEGDTKNIFPELYKKSKQDLKHLVSWLEFYISKIIYQFPTTFRLPCIEKGGYNFTHFLSFNYTNTFEKVYDPNKEAEYCHIHGKAGENDHLILGIDEYLTDEEKDKNTKGIEFKKFFQRIYYKTSSVYMDWLDELKKPTSERHTVVIFGHSLGMTDADVLRRFLKLKNADIHIYYHDEDAHNRYIQNVVKIIGQDELIRRIQGKDKTIEFRQQGEFVAEKSFEVELSTSN